MSMLSFKQVLNYKTRINRIVRRLKTIIYKIYFIKPNFINSENNILAILKLLIQQNRKLRKCD